MAITVAIRSPQTVSPSRRIQMLLKDPKLGTRGLRTRKTYARTPDRHEPFLVSFRRKSAGFHIPRQGILPERFLISWETLPGDERLPD